MEILQASLEEKITSEGESVYLAGSPWKDHHQNIYEQVVRNVGHDLPSLQL